MHQVEVTPAKPHGLDYALTLHGPDGTRLVGFDNAHRIKGKRRTTQDHRHRLKAVRPYEYRDAADLLTDFWTEVESVMREKGIWQP